MGKISSLYKIFIEITFGKRFYNMYKYCKTLLIRKKVRHKILKIEGVSTTKVSQLIIGRTHG